MKGALPMKKKLSCLVLCIVLIFGLSVAGFAETLTNTTVLVNNQKISAVSSNGIVLTPIYELSKALGASYSFDSSSYSYLTTKITHNDNEVVMTLNNSIAQVNGKYLSMPSSMRIINNKIYVPTIFVSNSLGAQTFNYYGTNTVVVFTPKNNNIIYTVKSGDSLWKISQTFGVSIDYIRTQNKLTSDSLYVGQSLIVAPYTSKVPKVAGTITTSASLRTSPSSSSTLISYLQVGTSLNILGKTGNWYKVSCAKGTGYVSIWVTTITQEIANNTTASTYFSSKIPVDTSKDTISYKSYTVVKGDTVWSIAEKNGIPDYELRSANNLSSSSVLYIGQVLKVPVHNIGIRTGVNGTETLDWFSQANYVFPIGKVGKLIDPVTGKSFMIKRTMGASHSDTETLTAADTAIMKEIFGGSWTWNRKSFILEVAGRRIAVSAAGMPHAGVDGVAYYQNVANRSDNYGYGPNLDRISGNGMNGHFDLYFLNCLRHKDNQIDPAHQLAVSVAGGLR